MSEIKTPRTDKESFTMDLRGHNSNSAPHLVEYVSSGFTRQIERELTLAKQEAQIFKDIINTAFKVMDATEPASHENFNMEVERIVNERDQLKQQLGKDKERLDFIAKVDLYQFWQNINNYMTRQAIDAAIESQKKGTE